MTQEWNWFFRPAWAGSALPRGSAGTGYAWAMPQAAGPQPALIPGDSMFASQWHLNNASGVDINVTRVWNDYTGQGVLVGVIDDGIDYTHLDLAPNYNFDADYDARARDFDAYPSSSSDRHGTAVAGVIAAAADGSYGAVGVAPGADIAGFRMGYGSAGSISQIVSNLQKQASVDVSNNSWKYGGYFYDNFSAAGFSSAGQAIADAAANGRGGLGTVFVFAAGNDRTSGDDVNYHNFQNSKYVIAVAAVDSGGAISYFSNPGAAVLVAAPGSSITTTDRVGSYGYSSGDFTTLSGTSFSTPVVSGVTALMLETNPGLGYRDVQEILAYSAARPATLGAGWQVNGADSWNGGGLQVSHDYGYGIVDALAAVRLAETWRQQGTVASMASASASAAPGAGIVDFATVTSQLVIGGVPLLVDRVDVAVNISHTYIGDLTVTLTSPSGTTSVLVDRPGNGNASQDNIVFTLDSVQFWGELSNGTWTLAVSDSDAGYTGVLNSWTLTVFGDTATADDLYVYTDDYARYSGAGDAARRTLTDAGGDDALNAAAVSGNTVLDLNAGGTIAGNSLTIAPGTVIETVFFGDGDDTLVGNGADNLVLGGRGDDWLDGGAGLDTALYFNPLDHYLLTLNADLTITVDFTGADGIDDGVDLLANFEAIEFDGVVYALGNLVGLTASTPPVAGDDAYATDEDTPLIVAAGASVLANDTDADGDILTLDLLSGPAHGSLTLNADGSFIYTPAANWWGPDSFTYEVSDGNGGSDSATVSLTVNAVNDAPEAAADAYATSEDTALVIAAAAGVLANDSDVDGDTLAAALVAAPEHGALVLNADGSFTYVPDANYHGADNFTYRVSDGAADSNIATVNLTVNPVNDAPVAFGDAYATGEDTALVVAAVAGVLVNDGDVDGDGLSAVLVAGPAHGALTLNADGSFTYTPTADYHGADSFTYRASDGAANSGVATVDLTVSPVDDTPVATNDTYVVAENGTLLVGAAGVLGNDSDADGDALTAALVAGPAQGTLVLNADGSFGYTPDAGYSGNDSFTYQASDGALASNTATVSITVSHVNVAPVAATDAYATSEDTQLVVAAATGLLANDGDANGDVLSAMLVAGPAHGTLNLDANGSFSYTPDAEYHGADSFTYRASDGVTDSADTVVSLTINSVNDLPVAGDDAATTPVDTPVTIAVLANDSDADGDSLTPALVSGPSHGNLVLNGDGTFTYSPAAGYTGADAFVYQVSDGAGGSDAATVSLQVTDPYTLITGSAASNLLIGGSGDDRILGLGGNDRIYGFGGNDLLEGGDGADQLNGGAGDDILIGGPGSDRLYGSSGADIFRYTGMGDSGDSIRDFARGVDRIDIHDVLADAGYAGSDPVADGWLTQVYNPGTGGIDISIDRDGVAGPSGFTVLASVTSIGSTPLDIGTDLIV